ncbi:asialoglycoprotein receptor-like 1 [Chanos chanos]|uniref:Asialoglycoprotein receptor-like 1 n=1 Tax=Chanos chanos TaxID=29144 RepID=A0A6J2UZU8_CHACN|nr:hepatic lectin-like [Chanos chanos]
MESSGYDQFGSSSDFHRTYPSKDFRKFLQVDGRQNRTVYILFGFLLLFLIILTMAVGIKFSQMKQEIADIRLAQKPSVEKPPTYSGYTAVQHHTGPVRGDCEEDWYYFKGSCYFLSTLKMNWHAAERSCMEKKAHLLVVNNLEEMEYISRTVSDRQFYWIGLVEREKEGEWSWVDGTDINTTPKFWDRGQPDDWAIRVNGEDCAQLHPEQGSTLRKWNDADCTLSYFYICEVKVPQ